MRRVPLVAMQKAVYELLCAQLPDVPVYDDVPEDARPPFITFGDFTCTPDGAKGADINVCVLNLDIWSVYGGKKEVNEVADKIIQVLANYPLVLKEAGFYCIMKDIEEFESYDDVDFNGYHGVVSFSAKIQNMRR